LYIEDDDRDRETPKYSYFRRSLLRKKTPSLGAALEFARWDIHSSVPELSRDFLFLHAGGVATDGEGLLLPAPPDAGKSSLVAALLQEGFDYLSDDLGPIDPVTTKVYPFEKRISLRESAIIRYFPNLEGRLKDRQGLSRYLKERFVRPEDLEADVAGPSKVRWVVFPTRDRDGLPRLSQITKAEAIQGMTANAFNLSRYEERGVVLLSRVAAEAESFRLDGGTAPDRAALLAERFLR
jgi:hypothetical protein